MSEWMGDDSKEIHCHVTANCINSHMVQMLGSHSCVPHTSKYRNLTALPLD